MERRKFITLLGGAAAGWPLAARAQQVPAVKKVGFLYPGPEAAARTRIPAFLEGLRFSGFRVPEQVEFISRIADADPVRLAPLAAELIDRKVDVIVAISTGAVHVVRAATASITLIGGAMAGPMAARARAAAGPRAADRCAAARNYR